jgi:hypothetical protein
VLVFDKYLVDPVYPVALRGLSFIPAGELDADKEALVTMEIYGGYLKIDVATKTVTVLGNLNGDDPAMPWATKGADVVSIIGAKTYVTAKKIGNGGDPVERLVVLDPKTGAVTQEVGSTGIIDTFGGLAFWAGTLYGFTADTGKVFAIDPATAQVTDLAVKNLPAGVRFDGAGVTTAAPLEPPK